MKKFLSVLTVSALCLCLLYQSAFAAAPPRKDGVIFSGNTSCGKRIALTFDDGPHPVRTPKILDILGKYGVKATFFIVGAFAESYPEIVADEHRRGHELANHSFSHAKLSVMARPQIKDEIVRADEAIRKASGITPKLFRPPEGAYSPDTVDVAKSMGKETVIWTVDTKDWAKSPCNAMVDNIKKNVTSGSIILFHDCAGKDTQTIEALEIIIPYLISQGYEFVTVSELIASENQTTERAEG